MENKIEELIHSMLIENTGIALCDSGGEDGRMWQRNAGKTLADFKNEPEVSFEPVENWFTLTKDGEFVRREQSEDKLIGYMINNLGYSVDQAMKHEGYKIEKENTTSEDILITVSTFHYLTQVLELDEICEKFNALKCEDWDSDVYGISQKQKDWLLKKGFEFGDSWNTYNGENNLSQVLQGTELKIDGLGEGEYVLLQVHGGADVRGGYTNAKLVKYQKYQEMIDPCPHVFGTITKPSGEQIEISTNYNGYSLTGENGEKVEVSVDDIIDLLLGL